MLIHRITLLSYVMVKLRGEVQNNMDIYLRNLNGKRVLPFITILFHIHPLEVLQKNIFLYGEIKWMVNFL